MGNGSGLVGVLGALVVVLAYSAGSPQLEHSTNIFGSERKAQRQHGDVRTTLGRDATGRSDPGPGGEGEAAEGNREGALVGCRADSLRPPLLLLVFPANP